MKIYYRSIISPKVILKGTYNGYRYYIVSMGSHPCVYILLPKGHELYGLNEWNDCDLKCHGGITYSRNYLLDEDIGDDWVIGMDYAHVDDYLSYENVLLEGDEFGHKYTMDELMEDVKITIDDLVSRYENSN